MISKCEKYNNSKLCRNNLLDFIKGCGCIGVVFIHVTFPGVVGEIIKKFSEYAVPIFLMTSGFFSYNKNGDTTEKIKRRIKRIGRIFICAFLLYFIGALVVSIKEHTAKEFLLQFLSWKQWIKIIVFSDFDGIKAWHLWFLPSLIYSYMLIWFVEKKNLYRLVYKLLPILFTIRIIVCTIVFSLDLSWHLWGNFFVGALPWFWLGNYIAHNENFRRKYNNFTLVILALGGMIFACVFVVFDLSIDLSEIGIVVCSTSLFLLAVNNPLVSINKGIEKLGDVYSLYVYIIHILVSGGIGTCMQILGSQDALWFVWSKPIIVAVVSIIGSIILYHLPGKIKCILHPSK